MKNIICFIILACCFAAHGAEDDHKSGAEHKLQSKGREVNPLKGIRRDPPDEKQTPPTKRQKKVVEFDFEPPSLPIPPLPSSQITDQNVILERMGTSKEYLRVLRVIYQDAEQAGIRDIAGMTQSQAIAVVGQMRRTREYAQLVDFGNYMIRNASDRAIIGRLMFANYVYGSTPDEGFLQTQFHLISEFRGKGLGSEVLERLIKDLIGSKIGKKCSLMRSALTESPPEGEEEVGSFENTLRGVYGKSSLLTSHILEHNGTIAAYYKAGFGVKIWNGDVIMSYPPECFPPGPSLLRKEVATVLAISKLMQDCRVIKMKNRIPAPQKPDSIPEEVTIELSEILRNPKDYATQTASLKKRYQDLLAVAEPFTFLSVLTILHTQFRMTKEDLDSAVSSEKALNIIALLQKATKIPDGLGFLERFAPLSNDLIEEVS